jgi:hypothetical protein
LSGKVREKYKEQAKRKEIQVMMRFGYSRHTEIGARLILVRMRFVFIVAIVTAYA